MIAGPPAGETTALELRRVVKRFGTVVAVDGVDFALSRGSVHALLGENGAGKSTLMRIAYGLVRPDEGSITLLGSTIPAHDPQAATRAGVGMVHQHLSLVPSLTSVENLALGGRGLFHPAPTRDRLRRTAEASGLHVPADVVVRDLSIVEQQRLEILKALARGAQVLILDEPTSMLGPSEVEELLHWIRGFARDGGSVVLVTHKLREALAVADHVTVMRRGRVTFTASAKESTEADLARAMFPEELDRPAAAPPLTRGEAIVVAEHLRLTDARGAERVRDTSFVVSRHEIVGVAAIEGSGHRELLIALAGIRAVDSGHLWLPERRAFVPADRLRDGLIPDFTLTENVALRDLGIRSGLMPWAAMASRTAAIIDAFAIAAPSPGVAARALSGGNQQRLVVGRELDGDVDLVVADNPTRGLDIRASAFVHDQLRAAAARGAAVVFHSSDLDEILALATRVLVVFRGVSRDVPLDRAAIGRAMVGAESP